MKEEIYKRAGMICKGCGSERTENDFLGQDICFRCQYRKKMDDVEKKKVRKCRECSKIIITQRWVYCSLECACNGKKQLDKDYWEANITFLK